jgi:hypothetical protein
VVYSSSHNLILVRPAAAEKDQSRHVYTPAHPAFDTDLNDTNSNAGFRVAE